jgi:hypothetical protein
VEQLREATVQIPPETSIHRQTFKTLLLDNRSPSPSIAFPSLLP